MSTKWFVDLYRPNVCTLLWTTTYTACRQWGVNIKSFCQYNGKFLQIPVWFKVGEAVISNFKKTSTSTNKLLMRRQLLTVTATHSTKRLEKISAVLRQYQNQTASDRQMDRQMATWSWHRLYNACTAKLHAQEIVRNHPWKWLNCKYYQ